MKNISLSLCTTFFIYYNTSFVYIFILYTFVCLLSFIFSFIIFVCSLFTLCLFHSLSLYLWTYRNFFWWCLCQLFIPCKIVHFNTLFMECQILTSLKLDVAGPDFVGLASLWMDFIKVWKLDRARPIPHICHKHQRRCLCKNFLSGVNFSRLSEKNAYIWLFQRHF